MQQDVGSWKTRGYRATEFAEPRTLSPQPAGRDTKHKLTGTTELRVTQVTGSIRDL